MTSCFRLPRLYAILDAEATVRHGADLLETAYALQRAGVQLLQYRDKKSSPEMLLRNALEINRIFAGSGTVLILNDRVDLVHESSFRGVHLGQEDMPPEHARRLLGPDAIIGLSTHTLAQASAADRDPAVDYVAVGPVFQTATKANPEPSVGLEELRIVRAATLKPLVAIGGITRKTAADVLLAGADSLALIGALFSGPGSVEETARELQLHLSHVGS